MQHLKALTNYTQRAFYNIANVSLINEIKFMRQAVQNQIALDILTAAEGGTCAIIKAECFVYIPGSVNI